MKTPTVDCAPLGADELARNQRWWQIYRECFPLEAERETERAILDSLQGGVGAAFHAQHQGGTVAIARTHVVTEHIDFLAYLGVTEAYRRRGIGETLFRFLPEKSKIFEVEDPEHAAVYGTTEQACAQRIEWYERHFGATLLEQRYLQPPLIAGTGPLPFRLMWTGTALGDEQVRAIVRRLYDRFYRVTNGVARDAIDSCFARTFS